MPTYCVLGLGMMGTALCFDLLSFDSESTVYGLDKDPERRSLAEDRFSSFVDRFQTKELNLRCVRNPQTEPLITFLKEKSVAVVFGAIDYQFNEYLTQVCITAGAHFLDLGGNPTVVEAQHKLHPQAQEAGVTIIPDCGLAPGMADIIAAHLIRQFDEPVECHIRVGGLPQEPKTILNYQQVFSIRGLTNEYLEDAYVIRDGAVVTVPSLSEVESIRFVEPYGELEAFQTAGGTSSLPKLFEGKIKHLTYKTLRYPGHCQFFKFLKDFGLLSSEPFPPHPAINPRVVTEHCLQSHLPRDEPDVVLVRVTAKGSVKGEEKTLVYELVDLYDEKTGFSAMARTTSYPVSIIGLMIAKGTIAQRGVLPGEEVVPASQMIDELAKRSINFSFTEHVKP